MTGHVVEDDVSGGGAVQHLQAGHHEDRGAGVLGGDVAVKLNLRQNNKLEKEELCYPYVVSIPLEAVHVLPLQFVVAPQVHLVPLLYDGGESPVVQDLHTDHPGQPGEGQQEQQHAVHLEVRVRD